MEEGGRSQLGGGGFSLYLRVLGPLQSEAGNAFLLHHESSLPFRSMIPKGRMLFRIILWLRPLRGGGVACFEAHPEKCETVFGQDAR